LGCLDGLDAACLGGKLKSVTLYFYIGLLSLVHRDRDRLTATRSLRVAENVRSGTNAKTKKLARSDRCNPVGNATNLVNRSRLT
jgi:hypothetical protein